MRIKSAIHCLACGVIALLLLGCSSDPEITDFFRNSKAPPGESGRGQAALTVPPEFDKTPPEEKKKIVDPPVSQDMKRADQKRQDSKAVHQDVYDKWGVSKTKPDGTPKTTGEMREEVRQKYLEEKRKENPNYGTVLNSGSVLN